MSRWLVGAAAVSLAACGVDLACTEIGCNGAVVVEVSGLADGLWTLSLTTDAGDVVECTFQLPNAQDGSCTGDLTVALADSAGVLKVTVQTGMTDGAPFDSLGLTATDADGVAIGGDVTPAWGDPLYPNGESCDAPFGCFSAEAAVTLMPAADG